MVRWQPGAPGRLQLAALELFEERGYERTTVADIAARAGLTERTFYRHFADKREVLMFGSAALQQSFVQAIAEAPADAAPLDAIAAGFDAIGVRFDELRPFSLRRQAVLDAAPAMQERESMKLLTLGSALADALREHGIPDPDATLAAQAGIAVFHVAFARWIRAEGAPPFATIARETLARMRAVAAR